MIDNLLCPGRFAPAQLSTTKAQIIHAGFDRKYYKNDIVLNMYIYFIDPLLTAKSVVER